MRPTCSPRTNRTPLAQLAVTRLLSKTTIALASVTLTKNHSRGGLHVIRKGGKTSCLSFLALYGAASRCVRLFVCLFFCACLFYCCILFNHFPSPHCRFRANFVGVISNSSSVPLFLFFLSSSSSSAPLPLCPTPSLLHSHLQALKAAIPVELAPPSNALAFPLLRLAHSQCCVSSPSTATLGVLRCLLRDGVVQPHTPLPNVDQHLNPVPFDMPERNPDRGEKGIILMTLYLILLAAVLTCLSIHLFGFFSFLFFFFFLNLPLFF